MILSPKFPNVDKVVFTVRLEQVRDLSSTTKDFRFVRTDGAVTNYKPGQFFRFLFEDDKGTFERSYSLCNFDELYGSELELVISRVDGGRATELLFDHDVAGIEVSVTGPFGRLVLPETVPGRLVMVATSVGLAPYMPILKQLESLDYPEVVLLLGARDRQEFIYGDKLLEYAARNEWFDLRLCLSRDVTSEEYERDGYVTAELEKLDPDPDNDHVLLCGNPHMIDDAWKMLRAAGFRAKQVVREKYVFAREAKKASGPTEDQKRLIAEKLKKFRPG